MKKKIYIVAGPTASGKTKLAIDLAIHKKGEIINADSLQVYQDVPILTARPTEAEQQSIPHHLFGFLDAFAVDNVQSWLNKASLVVKNIETPIFVGGTGMYIKMLTEGISPIPDIPCKFPAYSQAGTSSWTDGTFGYSKTNAGAGSKTCDRQGYFIFSIFTEIAGNRR